jgi:hypothetical protein
LKDKKGKKIFKNDNKRILKVEVGGCRAGKKV